MLWSSSFNPTPRAGTQMSTKTEVGSNHKSNKMRSQDNKKISAQISFSLAQNLYKTWETAWFCSSSSYLVAFPLTTVFFNLACVIRVTVWTRAMITTTMSLHFWQWWNYSCLKSLSEIAEPHKWSVCYAFQLWSENILGEYILGNVIPHNMKSQQPNCSKIRCLEV